MCDVIIQQIFPIASLVESSDELRYKLSLLQSKRALLTATDVELSSKTSADVNRTLNQISSSLLHIRQLIANGVDKLLQMEVECFTRVNLSVCNEIINGHAAFRFLLQELAGHFAQAEYLESILRGRPQVIKVIREKLLEVQSGIEILEAKINETTELEAGEIVDLSTSSDIPEVTSCPGVGQIKFTFDSTEVDSDCRDDIDDACFDIAVPINASSRHLWNVESCTIDSELKSYGMFESFVKLMNSVPFKVTASLMAVNVRRPWFDVSLFEDSDHFTMVGSSKNLQRDFVYV